MNYVCRILWNIDFKGCTKRKGCVNLSIAENKKGCEESLPVVSELVLGFKWKRNGLSFSARF